MFKVQSSQFTVSTALVFMAMGFLGPNLDGLLEELGVRLNVFGGDESRSSEEVKKMLRNAQPMFTIYSDENFMTSEDGVFVAGDANRGASIVVWAIWEGRESARCIDRYLMGTTQLPTIPQAEELV